jgi:hypothetical protein
MSDAVAGTAPRFELSIEDLRNQARAAGFWRGLSVGFLSAFFLFDGALQRGAAIETMTSLAAANMPAALIGGAAAVVLVVLLIAFHAVNAERARREKLERLRARLCA